jgi:imidazoleglycerol phosphate dehydratase HisB
MTEAMMMIMIDKAGMIKIGVTIATANGAMDHMVMDLQVDFQVDLQVGLQGDPQVDLQVEQETMGVVANTLNSPSDADQTYLANLTRHGQIVVAVRQKQQ